MRSKKLVVHTSGHPLVNVLGWTAKLRGPDGLCRSNGEERTAAPSISPADDGNVPDCAARVKDSEKLKQKEVKVKLGKKIRLATWNVRSMSAGKLENITDECNRNNVDILGIVEHRWSKQGHFSPKNGGTFIYSGRDKPGQSGVAIYLNELARKYLLG
ncbi:craniofacial development protein 2 [Elysia marginata]|uniref:Craniofacial development protein 2 n=1 Tax=Elysia marginata TaxID=1093978 RepID=A0AAV4IKN5_9GAST|nr:craniofacial development protein 2 [Elysia marginata]